MGNLKPNSVRARLARKSPPVLCRITVPDGHFLNRRLTGKSALEAGEHLLAKAQLWYAGEVAPAELRVERSVDAQSDAGRRERGRPSRKDAAVLCRVTLPQAHFLNEVLAGRTPREAGLHLLEKAQSWYEGQAAPASVVAVYGPLVPTAGRDPTPVTATADQPERRSRGRPARKDPAVLCRITLPDGHFLNEELRGKTPLEAGEHLLEKTVEWYAMQKAPKAPASHSSRAPHDSARVPQSTQAPLSPIKHMEPESQRPAAPPPAPSANVDSEIEALLNW